MPNPDRLKNLRPFPKGHKYGGRPKGSLNLNKIIDRVLQQERLLKDEEGTPYKQQVIEGVIWALIKPALEGSLEHIRETLDRRFGKISQTIENNTTVEYEPYLSVLTREQLDEMYAKNQIEEDEEEE